MVGSGIRKKPIPDPGSRILGSKRYRIPDPDPQHCWIDRKWHGNKASYNLSILRKLLFFYGHIMVRVGARI
jgi:hypothetical protein